MDINKNRIGESIKRLRTKLRLSQEKFGQKLFPTLRPSTATNYVKNIEKGYKELADEELQFLLKIFDITEEQLYEVGNPNYNLMIPVEIVEKIPKIVHYLELLDNPIIKDNQRLAQYFFKMMLDDIHKAILEDEIALSEDFFKNFMSNKTI